MIFFWQYQQAPLADAIVVPEVEVMQQEVKVKIAVSGEDGQEQEQQEEEDRVECDQDEVRRFLSMIRTRLGLILSEIRTDDDNDGDGPILEGTPELGTTEELANTRSTHLRKGDVGCIRRFKRDAEEALAGGSLAMMPMFSATPSTDMNQVGPYSNRCLIVCFFWLTIM